MHAYPCLSPVTANFVGSCPSSMQILKAVQNVEAMCEVIYEPQGKEMKATCHFNLKINFVMGSV